MPAAIDTGVSARAQPRAAKRALKRMGRRIRVRVVVTLPGEDAAARRIKVKRAG